MSVPAHDERDFEFAKTFHLPVSVVRQRMRRLKQVERNLLFVGDGTAMVAL